jgi:hypothetical protein
VTDEDTKEIISTYFQWAFPSVGVMYDEGYNSLASYTVVI